MAIRFIALILSMLLGASASQAQTNKAAAPAKKAPPAAAAASKAAPAAPQKAPTQAASPAQPGAASPAIPDEFGLNILIRRTLLTLNDANQSGNYSVLHALAGPGFQAKNDPKKLSDVFAQLRGLKLDLAPIVYLTPRLVRKPELAQDGILRLTGFIPSKPQQINFDMAFQKVGDRWLLDGIAIQTTPAAAAAAPAPPPKEKAK